MCRMTAKPTLATALALALAFASGTLPAAAQAPPMPRAPMPDAQSLPPHTPAAGTVRPEEGLIWRRDNDMADMRFTVAAPANGLAYLVSLYREPGHQLSLVMFVSPGQTHSVQVAEGTYHLHYDAGLDWYGPEKLFGPDTEHADVQEYQTFYPGKQADVGWNINPSDRALFESHLKGKQRAVNP